MKLYRFGIAIHSKSELGAVLGVFPYGGAPIAAAGETTAKCAFLSEQDIINRLTRTAGCKNDKAAVALFRKMLQEHRANCKRLKQE